MFGLLVVLSILAYLLVGTVVVFASIDSDTVIDGGWFLAGLFWPLSLICIGVALLFSFAAEFGCMIRKLIKG